jgi:hypothetical protein
LTADGRIQTLNQNKNHGGQPYSASGHKILHLNRNTGRREKE